MRHKKRIYLISIVLATFSVCLFLSGVVMEDASPVSVVVFSEGGEERIICWEKESTYYVFLPGYADLSRAQIQLNTSNSVMLNNVPVSEGMSIDAYQLNVPYELTYCVWGKEIQKSIVFMRSSNVGTMFVETQSGSMEYIHEKKGNEESGVMRLYLADGRRYYSGTLRTINGRGNATWQESEKKPYSLTLAEEADLLGMGAAQKWILLSNSLDASNLRNKIVYDFAKQIDMAYSPDCEWVDLYLNGEYAGLYLLCERNEIHPERVNISENGSFLVSLELEERLAAQNYPYVRTSAGQALRIHDPDIVTAEIMEDLSTKWLSVENALLAEDGIDPISGKHWLEMIDLDSWVRKYLVEEVFGNLDGCLVSQFFYQDGKNTDGKIYAGPVWDFDNALGNRISWELVIPETFHANQYRERNGNTSPWFFHLYQKEEFHKRLTSVYREEFLALLKQELHEIIPQKAEWITQASQMNQIRWSLEDSPQQEEIKYVIEYMNQRIDFLTSVWCNEEEYCYVYADFGHDCCYAVRPGECFTEAYVFPEQEYGCFNGWYYTGTNEPLDSTRPITEDVYIYTQWTPKEGNALSQIAKLLPLGIIAVMGLGLLAADIRKNGKRR